MQQLITLILGGLSVGLGNFAVATAIGLAGTSRAMRVKLLLVFGGFETGMPIVGIVIGERAARYLGGSANLIGGGLLVLVGIYLVVNALRPKREEEAVVREKAQSWGRLLLLGLALSLDNLVIGFGLGAESVPLWLAVAVIGTACVGLSWAGLELGSRMGKGAEAYSEMLSGAVLVLVGLMIGLGWL